MSLWKNSLWHNNPAIVQLIGLCPLLAVSNSVVTSLLLGACTIFVLVVSMLLISFIRQYLRSEIRLSVFVLLIASITTIIEILLQLLSYEFYLLIGLFIPLITTNCLLLARAEVFACQNTMLASFYDALSMGLGFSWVLVLMGLMREIMGQGTIFASMNQAFSFWPKEWFIDMGDFVGFPLFSLPPGGFIVLGLVLVFYNYLNQKITNKNAQVISNANSNT